MLLHSTDGKTVRMARPTWSLSLSLKLLLRLRTLVIRYSVGETSFPSSSVGIRMKSRRSQRKSGKWFLSSKASSSSSDLPSEFLTAMDFAR